jgi:hypothetical protein
MGMDLILMKPYGISSMKFSKNRTKKGQLDFLRESEYQQAPVLESSWFRSYKDSLG